MKNLFQIIDASYLFQIQKSLSLIYNYQMKIFLILSLLILLSISERALDHNLASINFPSKFLMKEKIVTVGVDYILEENDKEFGFVEQKITVLKKRFQLKNKENEVISTAEEVLYLGWRKFDITDSTGKKLGSIIVKPQVGLVTTKYQIKDMADQILGNLEYKQMFGKKYITVWNKDGKQEAYFENRFFSFFRTIFDVEFKENTIDRRLLIFLPSIVVIKN